MNDRGNRRLFLGCFCALVATAFGFAIRGAIQADWRAQFNLSNEQVGYISGAGLFPFAISIILFSLVVDRIGYGRTMVFAFVGHIASALLTIFAKDFTTLYAATLLFSLSNGAVEAVINPVVATVYDKNKTHWLNILHAGWPGGMVLGGLLTIAVAEGKLSVAGNLPGQLWQWQVALMLLPMLVYGLLLMGQRFPVQERVAAGVSYMDMLKEFGTASCFIVCFLLVAGLNQIAVVIQGSPPMSQWLQLAVAIVPTVIFAGVVRTFGRGMFVFLLLVMFLLATTELGTDSWIADIMRSVLHSPTQGTLFLVYTSIIMFGLRFFAGPIVHRISPLGLLAVCAAIAAGGLLWLSVAQGVAALFLAATFYGIGKTFFWPTTLGVVSEQYPKGGALLLNAIAGVGMLAVGVLGSPAIGYLQDKAFDEQMKQQNSALHDLVTTEKPGVFAASVSIDQKKLEALGPQEQEEVNGVLVKAKQGTLAKVAVLPMIMFFCYLGLIAYFRSKGGYQAQVLTGHAADDEEFTGGVPGPVE